MMVDPANWPRKRDGNTATEPTANDRARAELEEKMAVIFVDKLAALEKVLNSFRDNMNANIFVNWPALQAAGVDRNTPVSLNLKDVPYRKVLSTILQQVSKVKPLDYTIDEGIITISTKDDLSSQKYQLVKVFDIRDLLAHPPIPGSILPRPSSSRRINSGTASGNGIFSSDTPADEKRTAQAKEIIDAIQSKVAPETWRDKGGKIGSIRELNSQLIVSQIEDNQLKVYNFLQQLRVQIAASQARRK